MAYSFYTDYKFIPIVGNLYLFRKDNIEYLYRKYGYYYIGLTICVGEDVFGDLEKTGTLTSIIETYQRKKPLYSFHLFNTKQRYVVNDYANPHEIELFGKIYLNFDEANDMLQSYKPKQY